MDPVPDPGLTNPAKVPWYMHKRNQGTITTVAGLVLATAGVGPLWASTVIAGIGAIWGMVGHVQAEERKVQALVTAANLKQVGSRK